MQLKPTRSILEVKSKENQHLYPTQLLLDLPAIYFAPEQVLDHGLVEAHTFPLVSTGKGRGGGYRSFRIHASRAWGFASLELRSARAWPVLILDCDGSSGRSRLMLAVEDREIPIPNWVVFRVSGGAHGVWTLARPVLRGANAKARPLLLLGRISEYLAQVVKADAGYNGVLSHNPMVPDASQRLQTDWYRKQPYSLQELAEVVPSGWRKPAIPHTEIGRNCTMFAALMKFAGSPANLGFPVLPEAMAIYRDIRDQFPGAGHPFTVSEVQGIFRSVERYRAQWIKQGRFYTDAERSAWGRARGIRSGVARRRTTLSRDREIVALRVKGRSGREIARHLGVDEKLVRYVLRRDAPLLVGRLVSRVRNELHS